MSRRKPTPPSKGASSSVEPRGLYELDRFSEASLKTWATLSADLDELHNVLFFSLEPERRRMHADLLASLSHHPGVAVELKHWVRIVTYQFGDAPLSSAGSLHWIGGRFNMGIDVDESTLSPWPALYLAETYETAFREKFGLPSEHATQGLTPQELALEHGASHSTVFVRGSLWRLFDVRNVDSLAAVARVLARIKMPDRARKLMKKLQIPPQGLVMANTPKRIHESVVKHNWRVWPVQFGLPSPSHILANLIREAGFEGIIYPSSKGPGDCIALFPDKIGDSSFIELEDEAPARVKHTRLDETNSLLLTGWDSVSPTHASRARSAL